MTRKTLASSALLLLSPGLLFAGTVSGKITFTGTPAKPKTIDMSKEPNCAKAYPTPPVTESLVAGAGNTLDNVVVYISAGAPDEKSAPTQAVTFEQKNCRYTPHVLAMQVNQELKVVNSDQTSHNIHPLAKLNREWNKSQPPGTPPLSEHFDKEEFIPVKCNVHPWMRGYFAVLKTSHYALSAGDGKFSLPNLPAGKYTLTAWHEDYGTQTADVTITGSETKSVDFAFKAKAY